MRERLAAVGRLPLVRRVTGYSLGSIVAAATSEAAFTATYGWGHAGTTWASAAGFVGGAVPNYILNRRWAWPDRRSRDRRSELRRYAVISVASFLTSTVVTHFAESAARHLTGQRNTRVVLIALAYLGSSAIFFVIKFVLYERLVFTEPGASPARRQRAEPSDT